MFRKVISTLFVMTLTVILCVSVMAQVDCSLLDPRASVSIEKEGEVKASVDTLYKIAKAGGSVKGKAREEIQNLQKGTPVTEQGILARQTLYLYCGMVANASDISTERKVSLFKEMMEISKTIDKPGSKTASKKLANQSHKVKPSLKDKQRQTATTNQTEQVPNISQHAEGNQSPNIIVAPHGSVVVQYGEPSEKGKADIEVDFFPLSFVLGKVVPKITPDGSSEPVKLYVRLFNRAEWRANGAVVTLIFRPGMHPRVIEGAWGPDHKIADYNSFYFENSQLPVYAGKSRSIGTFEITLPRRSDDQELLALFTVSGDFEMKCGLLYYDPRTR